MTATSGRQVTSVAKRRRRALYQRRAKPYVSAPTGRQGPEARSIPAWGEAPRTPAPGARGPEARPIFTSIPKVTLLTRNPIPRQEHPQLILKRLLLVVRFLRIDVTYQRIQIARSYRERTIPSLPRKLRQCGRLALQPFRRGRLHLRNQIRDIRSAIQSNGQMNMIRNTTNAKTLALIIPNNRRQVGAKIRAHPGIKQRHTVFSAEHNMHEEKAQGSRHNANYSPNTSQTQ
jgi:hypothetical protein